MAERKEEKREEEGLLSRLSWSTLSIGAMVVGAVVFIYTLGLLVCFVYVYGVLCGTNVSRGEVNKCIRNFVA